MKQVVKTLIDPKILGRALLVGVLLEAGFMVRAISGPCSPSITACSAA